MTGRGIDQLMLTPNPPRLCEDYVNDAHDYVRLAEARSGPIARPVAYDRRGRPRVVVRHTESRVRALWRRLHAGQRRRASGRGRGKAGCMKPSS